MEGWEVWLGRHGEPCGQPLAATDLETMRGNAFIERFPRARRRAKVLNLDYPV